MTTASDFNSFTLAPIDNSRLANLCGQFDRHLRQIEQRLGVEINNRGYTFNVIGERDSVLSAGELLKELYVETASETLTENHIHLHLQSSSVENLGKKSGPVQKEKQPLVTIVTKRGIVKGRGPRQQEYLASIVAHDINFGVGPAGTGKTYLAVACAVEALEKQQVRRLILVRPAVEAGERLGFLPGDLAQKVDPYLRPLYDALYEMLGYERVEKFIERDIIEVAPLAYMRGRTLNDSFIILDEAQNTTEEQMKMFLTRIGYGSTAVITGDITQIDLPRSTTSGLRQVIDVLKGIEGISFTFFNAKDVVRHPLVQKIVTAYADYEAQ
ncbi:MAG: PhoH family protein [Thiohalomonadales bacterium]